MEALVECLRSKQLSLAVAESFTAGLFCEQLGQVPGVSTVFKGGVIAYSREAKHMLLAIDSAEIETYGVISAEIALAMAKQVKLILKSDVSIAFTGNAGPGVLEDKARGLWYLAICLQNQSFVYSYHSLLSRNDLRREAVQIGIQRLMDGVKEYTQ